MGFEFLFPFFFFFICPAKTSRSSNVTFKASISLIYFLSIFFNAHNMMALDMGFRGGLPKQNFGQGNKHTSMDMHVETSSEGLD